MAETPDGINTKEYIKLNQKLFFKLTKDNDIVKYA